MPLSDITNTAPTFNRELTRKRILETVTSKLDDTENRIVTPNSPSVWKRIKTSISTFAETSETINNNLKKQVLELKTELDNAKNTQTEQLKNRDSVAAEKATEAEELNESMERLHEENQTLKEDNISLKKQLKNMQKEMFDVDAKYSATIQKMKESHEEELLQQRKQIENLQNSIDFDESSISTEKEEEEVKIDDIMIHEESVSLSETPSEEEEHKPEEEIVLGVLDNSTAEPVCIPTFTNKSLVRQFKSQMSIISTTKKEWGDRVKAMKAAGEMLIAEGESITYEATWSILEKKFLKALVAQLGDLRSSIVKEACSLIESLSQVLVGRFDHCMTVLLPALFQSLFVSISIISSSSDNCIRSLLNTAHTIRTLPVLLEGCSDSHAIVRQRCAEYALIYLQNAMKTQRSENRSQEEMRLISSIVMLAINDSDKDCRKAGRDMFVLMREEWPEQAETMYNTFESQTKRALSSNKASVSTRRSSRLPIGLHRKSGSKGSGNDVGFQLIL